MTGSFCVKLKSKNGQVIVKDLNETMTLADLKARIAQLTQIKEEQLHILIGFPPRPLDLSNDTVKSIGLSGITSGETLIVQEKTGGANGAGAAAVTAAAAKTTASSPLKASNDIKKETSTSNSQLEEDEALARRLQAEEEAEAEAQRKKAANLKNNAPEPVNTPVVAAAPTTTPPVIQSSSGNFNGILLKKVVPADNSCLFTSIRFVLNGKVDNEGSEMMRHIIAQEVAAYPQQYNDAVLGKSNSEYCAWIQKPESWGGAIEVAILSNYYGIEIDVVDIQNAIINRFGEDRNYGLRVFLLFDGIHYDPLYMETIGVTAPATIFPVEEIGVYQQAEQLANEAKSARQFTNVDKFSLRCLQCDVMLVGQAQAQKHAKTTGHTNFSEI